MLEVGEIFFCREGRENSICVVLMRWSEWKREGEGGHVCICFIYHSAAVLFPGSFEAYGWSHLLRGDSLLSACMCLSLYVVCLHGHGFCDREWGGSVKKMTTVNTSVSSVPIANTHTLTVRHGVAAGSSGYKVRNSSTDPQWVFHWSAHTPKQKHIYTLHACMHAYTCFLIPRSIWVSLKCSCVCLSSIHGKHIRDRTQPAKYVQKQAHLSREIKVRHALL